ncbi:MAG: hypothetical protein PHX57_05610 [Desulfobulbaceae bacterium]|nr:hypothetical protein [Lascolabacillus sp.]MDD3618855.1 hypothetical protein [Desulfobulbaceae bacterium]
MEISESKIPWSLTSSIDADEIEKRRKKIPLSCLINSLNRINFKNGDILLKFKHKKYNNFLTIKAKPQRCNNTTLECLWSEPFRMGTRLKSYELEYFSFTDGLSQIQVHASLIDYNDQGFIVELPECSYEIKLRAVKRHPCREVSAQISQDGGVITGSLINFCAESFAVECSTASTEVNFSINQAAPAHVVLIRNKEFLFSGKCTIVRQEKHPNTSILVFKPEKDNIRRMKSKEHRTERLVLSPLPTLIFQHPLTQKKILLGLNDISGLGFSVEEDCENSVLLPGLIIPEAEIEFFQGFSIFCRAQALYRISSEDVVRCGMMILDMNIQDHIKLASLIHKAKNRHSYIGCTNVDLDALWDFFFDSGFVYPEKYMHIAEQKDKFLEIYKKLYQENPEIARHVIYQERGKIYGHVSMFRYYQKTWLLQHHAAVKSSKHKAGLVVMDHILQYINELHALPSARMNYIGCYFRPNNRFANRVFGASSRALNDLAKSSLDEFGYLYFQPDGTEPRLSHLLSFCETDLEDLQILQNWYSDISGGLLISALDLDPESYSMEESVCKDYLVAGFRRDRKLFSLKKDDELLAVLIVNISDFGMNLSELTNCIQFFALDVKQINKHIFNFAIAKAAQFYENSPVPVLFYPKAVVEKLELSCDKTYVLGLLNLDYLSEYLEFMSSLTTSGKSEVERQNIVKPFK